MASCDVCTSEARLVVRVTALPDQVRQLLCTRCGTLNVTLVCKDCVQRLSVRENGAAPWLELKEACWHAMYDGGQRFDSKGIHDSSRVRRYTCKVPRCGEARVVEQSSNRAWTYEIVRVFLCPIAATSRPSCMDLAWKCLCLRKHEESG